MANDLRSLVAQLSSGKAAEQAAAAEALARLGSEAQPAAAALVAALGSEDASTRDWCVAALEDLGPPPADQITKLTKLAADKSLDTAYWAITLLGRAGGDAASAADALVHVLANSRELALRERAAWALGKMRAKSASTALREAAAGDNPRLARLAQQALAEIELK